MSIIIPLQILRKGTKYESYRVSIPKSIIQSRKWEDKKFRLEVNDNKITLIPL